MGPADPSLPISQEVIEIRVLLLFLALKIFRSCHSGDTIKYPSTLDPEKRSPPCHIVSTGANDSIKAESTRMVMVVTGRFQAKSQATKRRRAEKVIRDPMVAKSRLISTSLRKRQRSLKIRNQRFLNSGYLGRLSAPKPTSQVSSDEFLGL